MITETCGQRQGTESSRVRPLLKAKLPAELPPFFVYNDPMNERISEDEFQSRAEVAISGLERVFGELAEKRDIDVELEGGVLTINFEEGEPGKFIVSPNSPARQIWVSARVSSFKFDWSAASQEFVLTGSDESLREVMMRLTQEQFGETDSVS